MNQNEKIKLFFTYAIKSLDTNFLRKMDFLADDLRKHPQIEFIEYKKLTIEESDPDADVKAYQHIESTICESDLFVVIGTQESIGLGIEIGIANQCKQKTLVCFDAALPKPSKMTTGSRVTNPNLGIIQYSSDEDLLNQIIKNLPVKI